MKLSDTAREAIALIERILAGRFTGKVELECNEGGVRRVHATETHLLGKLGRAEEKP